MNSELGLEKQYTVLHPADVELAETSTDLLQRIKVLSPSRLHGISVNCQLARNLEEAEDAHD